MAHTMMWPNGPEERKKEVASKRNFWPLNKETEIALRARTMPMLTLFARALTDVISPEVPFIRDRSPGKTDSEGKEHPSKNSKHSVAYFLNLFKSTYPQMPLYEFYTASTGHGFACIND